MLRNPREVDGTVENIWVARSSGRRWHILGKILADIVVILLIPIAAVCSQTEVTKLEFDASSIKPAGPFSPGQKIGPSGGPGSSDPGRVTMARTSLSGLIIDAYNVWPDQIVGPEWINDAVNSGYSITVTMPASTTKEQYRIMMQNLLAERFHLALRHATQTRPGYELVIAKGGLKIKEWVPPASIEAFEPGKDEDGFIRLGPADTRKVAVPSGGVGLFKLSIRQSMAQFCLGLAALVNISSGNPADPLNRVVDRTGLAGTYQFRLEFAGRMRPSPSDGTDDPDGPSIFVALERQLGLRLQRVKDIPIDVLIVDHADRTPTAN